MAGDRCEWRPAACTHNREAPLAASMGGCPVLPEAVLDLALASAVAQSLMLA